MGVFDFITGWFSRSSKGKAAKKSAAPQAAPKKKAPTKKRSGKKPGHDLTLVNKTKKRKKSRQVTADPIDKDALGFSISLKKEDESSKKRKAIRITVDGLTVLVKRLKKHYPVTDISATGLGFAFEKPRVKGGVRLEMDLYINGKLQSSGIVGKVMRHERGSVGCVFMDLDRAQDDMVHKIVLLGQKQMADRRNAKKDASFTVPK